MKINDFKTVLELIEVIYFHAIAKPSRQKGWSTGTNKRKPVVIASSCCHKDAVEFGGRRRGRIADVRGVSLGPQARRSRPPPTRKILNMVARDGAVAAANRGRTHLAL